MSRGFQGAVLRGFGAKDHIATVVATTRITPQFLRVTMSSPTLFDEATADPTAWLRFWFPDPDGSDKEFQRAYTIVEADPDTGEFSVDFVMHEPAGPASRWAATATPGRAIPVMSLGSSKFAVPEELPAGFLVIGDSASIPAINSIIGALPDDVRIELYLEEHDPADQLIPVAEHPLLHVHRVHRADASSLAAALENRDWSDWNAWVGAESGSVKEVRKKLREFGFPKSEVHAQAYWIHGRAMGKLRGGADENEAEVRVPQVPTAEPVEPPQRGRWRSQAAGELFAPIKRRLIVAGVIQVAITLLELAPFLLLVELARRLLGGAEGSELSGLGLWVVALLGGATVLGSALMLWLHFVDVSFSADVRRRLLAKLARLPLGWFTRRDSGSIKHLVQDDTLSLHYLVTHAIPDAVAAVVAPVIVLVYLFATDWRLALLLFVPILVYIASMAAMMVQSGAKIGEAMKWSERMNSEAAVYLDAQPVVRVFGSAAATPFRRELDRYIDFLNEWQRPFIGKKTFMDLATRPTTFLWLIVCAGTLLVVGGRMEPITLLPFLFLGTTFGARLLGIGYGLAGIKEGVLAARRIAATLAEPELTHKVSGEIPEVVEAGTVRFDRVGFGYRPGVPVVRDVSLTLRPGTVTALVGPSGSGKSTLASLLARFHDVDSGAILVDGTDVRSYTTDELYTRVGFVFQNIALVRGSVRDNIALARPDASTAEIEDAARAAQIHDRILRLPAGYDTVLGGSVRLSGGELQRITIARALLADTATLVLDEATAYADPESEYLVQRAIERLTQNRTVLVIAHRLHTIVGADRIVVLDGGRIVETGTHAELLATEGRYRQLWEAGADAAPESTREGVTL